MPYVICLTIFYPVKSVALEPREFTKFSILDSLYVFLAQCRWLSCAKYHFYNPKEKFSFLPFYNVLLMRLVCLESAEIVVQRSRCILDLSGNMWLGHFKVRPILQKTFLKCHVLTSMPGIYLECLSELATSWWKHNVQHPTNSISDLKNFCPPSIYICNKLQIRWKIRLYA
jgi:hypothetical protein